MIINNDIKSSSNNYITEYNMKHIRDLFHINIIGRHIFENYQYGMPHVCDMAATMIVFI